MRAMILAAGLGTRLKPLTDSTPKALIKIKNYTLLELQINKLKLAGFDDIIINVHHFADMIKDYLKQNNFFESRIQVSDESGKLLDTGGGLKKASHFFSDGKPFLVCNVDILSNIGLKNLIEVHLNSFSVATLAVQNRKSSRKFLFDKNSILSGWENEKSGEQMITRSELLKLYPRSFSGVQIIDPKIFNYFPDKDMFSLVDLFLTVSKMEKIFGYLHDNDEWMDLGKIEHLNEAEKMLDRIRNIYQV